MILIADWSCQAAGVLIGEFAMILGKRHRMWRGELTNVPRWSYKRVNAFDRRHVVDPAHRTNARSVAPIQSAKI